MAPVRRAAIDAAIARIVREIYPLVSTVPAGYSMPILAAIVRAGLGLLVTRTEYGAAFAASGFALETDLPALAVVVTSPGVYGLTPALHAAWVNRLPLIVLSGETSLPGSVQCGNGIDGPSVTRVTAPLCAWAADIVLPDALPGALARAVRVAATQRRPVHLNVPVHVASAEVSS